MRCQSRYPEDWKTIRARILKRAGNRCEFCRVPNYMTVYRVRGSVDWIEEDGTVHAGDGGEVLGLCRGSEFPAGRPVHIILALARLDHTSENNSPKNLKALCQRCHLRYTEAHRAESRRRSRRAKMAMGDLFEGLYDEFSKQMKGEKEMPALPEK